MRRNQSAMGSSAMAFTGHGSIACVNATNVVSYKYDILYAPDGDHATAWHQLDKLSICSRQSPNLEVMPLRFCSESTPAYELACSYIFDGFHMPFCKALTCRKLSQGMSNRTRGTWQNCTENPTFAVTGCRSKQDAVRVPADC